MAFPPFFLSLPLSITNVSLSFSEFLSFSLWLSLPLCPLPLSLSLSGAEQPATPHPGPFSLSLPLSLHPSTHTPHHSTWACHHAHSLAGVRENRGWRRSDVAGGPRAVGHTSWHAATAHQPQGLLDLLVAEGVDDGVDDRVVGGRHQRGVGVERRVRVVGYQ